jgi:hypothetical protein
MDISVLRQISSINDSNGLEKKNLWNLDEKTLLIVICNKLIDIEAQLKILNVFQAYNHEQNNEI